MTPDTTTTREYQLRWRDGSVMAFDARDGAEIYRDQNGGTLYVQTVWTTVVRSAWAEVVEAKEAQHG